MAREALRRLWSRRRVREATILLGAAVLLVAGVYLATGQPLGGTPVVVVTTGSMMHCDNGQPLVARDCEAALGRIGTIDPGDVVFVQNAPPSTAALARVHRYGGDGDVVVFQRNGEPRGPPVIHRALFTVQPHGDGTFDVPEFDAHRVLRLPPEAEAMAGCALEALRGPDHQSLPPEAAGLITRGDNNAVADQCSPFVAPVRPEWVLGTARAEVPWVGLVNLLWREWTGPQVAGCPSGCFSDAATDGKVILALLLVAVVAGPAVARRKRAKQD